MPNALELESRREWALLLAIVALVAITPLGHESTHPIVLFVYRTLLFIISVLAAIEIWKRGEFEVSPGFLGLCGLAAGLMWLSIMVNPGSRFDGFYRWYETVLFGAAFIAMAALHRTRNLHWKTFILWSVIAIDSIYLGANLIIGKRPLAAPFVNANYFASFLLVGFAGSIAILLFERDFLKRAAAAACALFLYYGMTQALSRGATLTAAAIFGLAILRFGRGRALLRTAMFIAAGLALLIGLMASPALLRKFIDQGQRDPYNYQRPKIWLGALRLIADHPILGVGMAEFYHVSKRYTPAVEGTVARYLKRPGIAHSEYLQYAAENGIPAALLLFSLAGYLVYLAVRRSSGCSPGQRPFQEAAILCAAGLGIHALVDNNWSVPVMAAGLTVFSFGDVLPMRPWPLRVSWPPRLKTAVALILLLLFAQSTVIPAAGLYFNEAGHQAYARGDLGRAESMHRLAAAIIANHDVLLDNAGTVYFDAYLHSHDRRMLELADVFFSRAIDANPNAEDPRHHMENVLIQRLTGKVLTDRRVHLQLVELEQETLRIDPFNPFIRRNLAEALYNLGHTDEAEHEIERAIAYEPNYVPGYLRLAEWESAKGHTAQAQSYRDKAVAIVQQYQSAPIVESYEAMLLGRPELRRP